ncbi:MAG: hypothetical protein Q9M33_11005 [Robiginitomaculum sp.]|nr:hypothetical protein [Robiginitomaculum sp.]MDQ7076976.1 hypothetical protein [Robiginitomaculum sp.]
MDRVQELVDIAFYRWQRAEMKLKGAPAPLACSSNVACAKPLSAKKRARLQNAFGKYRARH